MNFLKSRRISKNQKQVDVAKAVGISGGYYSMVETGERRPSPEVAKRIADVLGFGSEWYRLLETEESANKKPASAG
jgi:transcriptional regulator, XRE family